MDELSYLSEMVSLSQPFKPLSCNYQQSSWCSGFLQCGELGLITSCLFWALSNIAPSSSSVSQPILDNAREGKWSGGRRGYHDIWISQEISSCNIFKGLWTIPVTSWLFFPYWLVYQCWSFPLPPPSLFLMLPNPPILVSFHSVPSPLWPRFHPFANAFFDIPTSSLSTDVPHIQTCLPTWEAIFLCDNRSKRFLEDHMSCIQAFPLPVFHNSP